MKHGPNAVRAGIIHFKLELYSLLVKGKLVQDFWQDGKEKGM